MQRIHAEQNFKKFLLRTIFVATVISGSWKIVLELQFYLSHSKEFQNWLPAILVLQREVSDTPQYKL